MVINLRVRDLEWYRQLEGLVENSPDGELTCGADGRITFANAKAAELLGAVRGDLIGKSYADAAWKLTNLHGEPLAESALPPAMATLRGKPVVDFEHVAERPDSRRVVISANARPLVDESGAVTQVILTLRDITAHKYADDQLKESELHYRLLAESSDDHIFVVDRDERIRYANRAGGRLLGVSAREAVGHHAEGFFGSELWERLRKNLRIVFYLGRQTSSEVKTTIADHQVWLNTRLMPLRDQRGYVNRVMLVSSDITSAKVAEEALRASEQRFRTVLESAAAVVLVLSLDHKILEFNREAERIYGVRRQDAIGKDYFQMFLPEEAWEAVTADINKVVSGESTTGFENVVVSKAGVERVMSWHVNRVVDDAENPQAVIAIGVDVSARTEMEASLRASEERYRNLFAGSPVAMLEADISQVRQFLEQLRAGGVHDFREHFSNHPEDVAVCTRMIKIVDANKALLALFEVGAREDFAANLETIIEPGVQPEFTELLIALAEGDARITIDTHSRMFSGDLKAITLRLLALPNTAGTVIVSIIDTSRQEREGLLDKALNDLNVTVTSRLEFNTIADSVVVKGVEALGCDWGAIIFRAGSSWMLNPVQGPTDIKAARKLDRDEFATIEQLTQPRQVVICDDACSDQCLSSKLVREFGVRGLAIVPLVARERVIGAVVFGFLRDTGQFGDLEISFMEKLGVSVGLAMENARDYENELKVSQTLQETMLKIPESLEGITCDYLYESAAQEARVGGDFYDLFELTTGKIGIVMGDVGGKGLSAAATTSLVKSTLRAYAYQHESPAQILALTNEAVVRAGGEESFVTLFFGIVDKESGALAYSSAGHPPAIVRRRAGEILILESQSPAIGVFDDLVFGESEVVLSSGDRLVLYTDGVIEARSGKDLFGVRRLAELVSDWQPGGPPVSRIIFDRIQDFSEESLTDDVAIFALGLDTPDV